MATLPSLPGLPAELDGIRFRRAVEADLPECSRIHRIGIDAYLVPMGVPPMPVENAGLLRLHAHTLATDPSRFQVAERQIDGGAEIVAFGSAVERGPMWLLSMLFVDPAEQARGVGRALLQRLLPDDRDGRLLATCTDSAQPVSNGLYASFGIVPRMPFLNLLGRPRPGWVPPALPDGVLAERIQPGMPDGTLGGAQQAELGRLDLELLGFTHPVDHAFDLRERPWLFGYRDGSGRLLGYGYTSEVGRIGPIAVTEPELLFPIVAHLLTAVEPRGASSVWLGGHAGEAVAATIRAGMRLEGYPILACWSEPYADFTRYVPTSPGLI